MESSAALPWFPMCFHLLAFTVNTYGLVWDILYLTDTQGRDIWNYRGYGGKIKFLTFWSQVLQTVYFAVAVLNDLFGTNVKPWENQETRSGLQKARDYILSSMAFPMGTIVVVTYWGLCFWQKDLIVRPEIEHIVPRWLCHTLFVAVTFWGIYVIDRELVFPKVLDVIIPPWLNHIMHTTVLLFLLVEKFLVYHHYPSHKTGVCTCIGFAAVYQAWILWIAFYAEIWVYPVLAVLTMPSRMAFLAVLWVFVITFYLLGQKLTNTIWDTKQPLKGKQN